MKNLENYGVVSLENKEIKVIDGGHVPMDYYMDDDTMAANAKLVGPAIERFWNFISFFL